MKRITAIMVVFLLAALGLADQAQAQRYRKKEISLISFKLYVDPDYRAKLESYSNLFPEPQASSKVNKIDNLILYTSWDIIKRRLEGEVGMIILPIDAYGDKFSYDMYGFPDISINKALSKGRSKYYIKLDLELVPEHSAKYTTQNHVDSARKIVQLKEDEIKPKVVAKLTIYSDKGIVPVANCVGEATTKSIITLSSSFFDGVVNSSIDPSAETLYNLIDKASQQLIISVYENK